MTNKYDPRLQALFAQAEQAFDSESFAQDVMVHIDRDRRRAIALWGTIGAVVLVSLALLVPILMSTFSLVSGLLPTELVQIETTWLRQLLSPVNSIAAAVAVGGIALRRFYLFIFR